MSQIVNEFNSRALIKITLGKCTLILLPCEFYYELRGIVISKRFYFNGDNNHLCKLSLVSFAICLVCIFTNIFNIP